jgi:hypothetical protein
MMRWIKALGGLLLASALVACGGGGGNPGTPAGSANSSSSTGGTGGTGSSTTTANTPTMVLSVVNTSGTAVAGNSVTSGTTAFVKAQVKDGKGAAVPNKLVTFTSGTKTVAFQPASGQVLTDSSGIASVQVMPASVSSAGADTVTAATNVDNQAITGTIDVQTSAANVSLASMTAAQGSLSAYQNTTVSVNVAVNGSPATNTPVTVGFSATCGSFSPASANSDSTGKASSTFQAGGCAGGTATLTASAPGASPVQTTVTVQAPQATNLLFVSATPSLIYTSAASSGDKQSTLQFKVVDAAGNPIGASTQVQVSLSSAAIAAGVVFADTGTTAPRTLSTDANGVVSAIVKSGGFPTPVSVTAALVSNPAITASSSGLTVNSGRAVQNFFSPSASQFNIEGWAYDGVTTSITVRVADRLGQPVPAGTPVSFISEGGQVQASCTITIDSNNLASCSVTLQSQNFRPADGRVSVLAYMDGDEIFVDANGNNRYDVGETFIDMGQPFLDSNENGVPDVGEQKVGDASVPGSGIGTKACTADPSVIENVPNTCDGVWGPTRVRGRLVIVFSDSYAITNAADPAVLTNVSDTGLDVLVRDLHNNPLPAGTTVAATISGGINCSVKEVIPAAVPSTTAPTFHRVIVSKGSGANDTCSGAQVSVKTTTPKNNVTLLGAVNLP